MECFESVFTYSSGFPGVCVCVCVCVCVYRGLFAVLPCHLYLGADSSMPVSYLCAKHALRWLLSLKTP